MRIYSTPRKVRKEIRQFNLKSISGWPEWTRDLDWRKVSQTLKIYRHGGDPFPFLVTDTIWHKLLGVSASKINSLMEKAAPGTNSLHRLHGLLNNHQKKIKRWGEDASHTNNPRYKGKL
jgi:hypothetical protein